MKILLVTDEVWNDRVFGNNVLTNWFEGMPDVELAQVFAMPGKPLNKSCKRYYQVTDMMMLKSIFGKKAGDAFYMDYDQMQVNPTIKSHIYTSKFYGFMKRISGTPVRLMRELLWNIGRYDTISLSKFISDFNPDIVFCPRLSTWKSMRLEKTIAKMTDAPFVAFTADDEASFREYSWSPLYWINRFFFHLALKKHIKLFKHYFTFSQDQANEYSILYGISTSTLFKNGDFPSSHKLKKIGDPIKLVYAGRLYCNRWKSLVAIGNALKEINQDRQKVILNVYTQDNLTAKQKAFLTEDRYIYLKGSVTPLELKRVYQDADIALHVESFDKKYRLATRTSFSTKIIDLMASTCAIIAITWKEHAGYKYLKNNDAALCVDSYDKILPLLKKIIDDPSIINIYAEKAYTCGVENHNKKKIQNQIQSSFNRVRKEIGS